MGIDLGKGWLSIPGIRERADRTIAEQMMGLNDALLECKGKTVLDLGRAEGAIGLEFAKAGAAHVVGIESLETHFTVARRYCQGHKNIVFIQAYLQDYIPAHEPPEQFDIVLALGIVHKLPLPSEGLEFACRSARSLVCFRAPAAAWDGWIIAKHSKNRCHVPTVMRENGFELEKHIPGARGEGVEYFRRMA